MRPEDRVSIATTDYMHRALDGMFVHVPNEGADVANGQAWGVKRAKMGVVTGWPDHQALWQVRGNGADDGMGRVAFLEAKKPGWWPGGDKRWREGRQPIIHAQLRAMGFFVGIFRSVEECERLLDMAGAPLRMRILGNNAGLMPWQYEDWTNG